MIQKITFTLFFCTLFSFGQYQNTGSTMYINEIDVDQENTDTLEFIELRTSTANQSLDGYIVVLFNGGTSSNPDNRSYRTIALDGYSTDSNGFFIIGGDAVPNVDLSFGNSNRMQNGPDAVAVYAADASSFPNGTPPTIDNLIDAIVYGTGDADDIDLLVALNETIQFDEDLNGNSENESLQRKNDDTYCTALPSLDMETFCPVCEFSITNIYSTCDANTSGIDSVTIALDFEGGGEETFTTTLVAGNGNISGDNPSTQATGTLLITNVDEQSVIILQLESLSCSIIQEISTPACLPIFTVETIAQLRSSRLHKTYRLTGEVLLTFQQDLRNQKFIEDASAAILLDDPNHMVSSTYAIGDSVTGVTGLLEEINGMLVLVPSEDPGPPTSSGNSVRPKDIGIEALRDTPENFESQYVQIGEGVAIDRTGLTTWVQEEVYDLLNPHGSFPFRVRFPDVDYVGDPIPMSTVSLAGIITQQSSTKYYITSRSSDDVHGVLATGNVNTPTVTIYPNPLSGGYLYIENSGRSGIEVIIHSVSGKKVLSEWVANGLLDVSSLKCGLYLITLRQEGRIQVRKLVVNE